MIHPTSPLAVSRARAAKLSRHKPIERLEDRIAPAYTASLVGSTVTFTGDGSGDFLTLLSVGGFLKHFRSTAGDAGFASDFDMVSGDGATETKLATGGAYTVNINAGGGDDTFYIGNFNGSATDLGTGTFNINGEVGTNDIINVDYRLDSAGRSVTIDASKVTTPGGITINYSNVEQVNHFMGSGDDSFTLNGSAAGVSYVLRGSGGTDTVNVTANGNFTLTNALLTVTAAGFSSPFDIKSDSSGTGIDVVNLTGGNSGNFYDLTGWTKSGKLTGSGKVLVNPRDTDFTLSDTSLSTADGMNMTLVGITGVDLSGGGGNNTFTVSSYTGGAQLTGGGGNDTFTIAFKGGSSTGIINIDGGGQGDSLNAIGTAGNDSLILSSTQLALLGGSEQINYAGLASVSVDGQAGSDAITISSTKAGVGYQLTGGSNPAGFPDKVIVTADGSFDLAAGQLTVTAAGFNSLPISLDTIETASLTGGSGVNAFTVNGWQGSAFLTGNAGNDAFALTANGVSGTTTIDGGTETDTLTINGTALNDLIGVGASSITLGNESVNYSAVETLNINGLAGDDTFTALGSAGGVTYNLDAGTHTIAGQDRIEASADGNFVLTDSLLTVSLVAGFDSPFHLTAFNGGKLTGGNGSNDFTVSGWTVGLVQLDGGMAGTDRVIATAAGNFALDDTVLVISGGRSFALTHINTATLTGDANANHFSVSNWTGTALLNGGGAGADQFDISFKGSGSGTVNVSGGANTDALTVKGTSGDDSFSLTPGNIGVGSELVTYSALVESVTVDGQGGNDPLTVSYLTPPVAAGVVFHYVGGGQDGDVLGFTGFAGPDVTWTPGAPNAGTVLFGTETYTYASTNGGLKFTAVSKVLLQTPAGPDDYAIAAATGAITGPGQKAVLSFVPNIAVDLGANDATPAADTFTINGVQGNVTTLDVKLGAGADQLNVNGVNALIGLSLTVDGGADSPDTFRYNENANVTLTPSSLVLLVGQINFSGFEQFDITADALTFDGTAAETVTWQPGVFAFGGGNAGDHAGSLIVENGALPVHTVIYKLDTPAANGPAPLTLQDVFTVNLETPFGADIFTMDSGPQAGSVTLAGTIVGGIYAHAGSLTNVAALGLDFGKNDVGTLLDKLTVSSLDLTGLKTLTVSTGDGDDTLELTSALTALALGTNPGEGFSFDGGPGNDTLKATSASPLNLGVTTLAIGNGGTLAHSNTEHFILDGGANGQVNYTGDGTEAFAWSPDVALTQQGTSTFGGKDLTYTGQLGVFTTASLTLTTPVGADAFTLGGSVTLGQIDGTVAGSIAHHAIFSGVPSVTIDLGTSDGAAANINTLIVNSLSAPALTSFSVKTGAGDDKLTLAVANLKTSTWDAGLGNDTLEASADVSMILAPGSLSFTDNLNHTSDFGHLTLTGSAVEVANLTGGAGANLFKMALFSGTVTVKGGDGNDTIDLDSGFIGTGSFQGEGNDDTFIVQTYDPTVTAHNLAGAGGGAAFDGGSGTDTVVAQGNLDITVTDTLITRTIPKTKTTPASSISNTLASFEHAILGGGAGTNVLNARLFTGTATLTGEGSIDNLIASKAGGDLFGFHASATASEMKTKLYTRDNFFASAGATTDHLHATVKAGNILSFRYSPTAVTYTIPNVAGGTANVGGGLNIELTEGTLTAVEGSIFGDHLIGNKKTNFLIGGKGNDTLKAVGFDYLYGGPGNDKLQGSTPFKFQNTNYPIPNSTGVPPV